MEIFIRNVDFFTSQHDITRTLASHLHEPPYTTGAPLNFHVRMFKPRKKGDRHLHQGCGALTLPTEEVGRMFLIQYGGPSPRSFVSIRGRKLAFQLSNKALSLDILISIQNSPYLDPAELEERERILKLLDSNPISLERLQFGWDCRDHVFSVEWDYPCLHGSALRFDAENRRICLQLASVQRTNPLADILESAFAELFPNLPQEVLVNFSTIDYVTCHRDSSGNPIIHLGLSTPPQFIQGQNPILDRPAPSLRYPFLRLSDADHRPHSEIAPYLSLELRLVCHTLTQLAKFEELAIEAGLNITIQNEFYPVTRRGLFSASSISACFEWLKCLDFHVAFQIERLLLEGCVDPTEILELREDMDDLVETARKRGTRKGDYITMVFREFGQQAYGLCSSSSGAQTLKQCFQKVKRAHDRSSNTALISGRDDDGIFLCMHVQITPTGMIFDGPLPERSNRVIRQYKPEHHHNFLRVSFNDEGRLQLQFNREIDGDDFVKRRVQPFFKEGLRVAGRVFYFLGYSQSALKEHAVYFMAPFRQDGKQVTTASVIKSLGSFADLPFDSRLVYCPARYAARISQGFTATDPTTTEVENIVLDLPDIVSTDKNDNKWVHTDGVGTMSPEFARSIHAERQSRRRGRKRPLSEYTRVLQIRFLGSKGVLSVDHTLSGKTVCLRPSMVKFQGTPSKRIEIAKVFDKPGTLYLNRPLIMLLEGLGVPHTSFLKFQDMAVVDAERSIESFSRACSFLEGHGLGASFRIPSVLTNLPKLGVFGLYEDTFYQKFMEYGKNHVLRLLKHRARIPVPGAWNLVGIADIHRYLRPGCIFACIKPIDQSRPIYLEGPVLVSRSPTIHPGDIQIVTAIGAPPPGSPFEQDDLANALVFATTDDRPLPSCLGGGDLDGDEYNVIPLNTLPEFWIDRNRIQTPGEYPTAKRRELDRPCTMDDVADFVMEYITRDVLGMVSINWRILADQTDIFNPNCMKMAELHSLAVDYPKSGNPVPIQDIPKRSNEKLPDWYAPETMYELDGSKYYPSQKAIGKLFRAITLDAPQNVVRSGRKQRRRAYRDAFEEELDELADDFIDLTVERHNPLYTAVETKVAEFIDIDDSVDEEAKDHIKDLFQNYRSNLESICSANTLASGPTAMLTEEEAVIGTIVANTSQTRKRLDHIRKLREQTDTLVRDVRESLAGDDDISPGETLRRAFYAWQVAEHFCHIRSRPPPFGARSFWWVSLGAVFEGIREIEQEEINERRREARRRNRA
ncbi:hypothetical protein WG66_014877 [Moniliophthora roreri]|uniref:RNA-dependent RNA polymerase n=1 Tax=Moniliophthora roreri TaxID=221103 RepID=A0A0W0G7T7_MONRR|nr:hypothetical protein WG66_014877 [Moniliophthora roreri]